ncbi:Malate (citrate)/Na+ symporter [Candidatus Phytoplasma mali]|uniref:Malate (Citrate)/Na+ symporter n=1 Tax=Phytoplasma mali (strain AT) TaxID=482235 RepID=B3R0H4_PHYMT|nr:2-hydroxycarboxylate transporter family protein [Candidatus Phytoplasma mali]CAP18338.1 Malate (citrate)/Na+ symporter [Candidatus Phytoplasma mali]
MHEKKNIKIWGINIFMFIFFIITMIINVFYIYKKPNLIFKLWHPLLTPLFICMAIGFSLNFIGKNVPVLNKLGLSFLLCIIVPSFLVHKGFIPRQVANFFDKLFFNKVTNDRLVDGLPNVGINFAQFFITIVISGSILSVNRELLKKSLLKFIPLTLIVIFSSIILTSFVGFLLNYQCPSIFAQHSKNSLLDSIFYICLPLTNGGTNLGINGFSNGIFKEAFPLTTASEIRSYLLPPLLLARILSIMFAGALYLLFDKTKFSGKGNLTKNTFSINNNLKSIPSLEYKNIGTGLFIILGFYSLGVIIDLLISSEIVILQLDAMVYVIIILLMVKIFNLISIKNQLCVEQTGKLMSTIFTIPVLAGLGLTTNFQKLLECVTDYKMLFMVVFALLISIFITFMLAKIFGFYEFEASLVSGISGYSIGGTGNVGVMSVSHREDLLPFSMIATRIVGPIMFVIYTISFRIIYMS